MKNTINTRECLDLNLNLLIFSSVCPNDISSSSNLNKLYRFYNFFTIFMILFTACGLAFLLIWTEYSLEELIEVISIIITQMRCLSRFFAFMVNRSAIKKLIEALYVNFYVRSNKFDSEEMEIIEQTMAKCRKITKCYVGLFVCTGISMVLQPLTAPAHEEVEDDFNGTLVPHRPLPFKTYFPKWNATLSPQYEIEYAAHSYLAIIESWGVGTIDAFCVTVLMYVSCQFELLGTSLKNLRKNVMGKVIYKRTVIFTDDSAQRADKGVIMDVAKNNPPQDIDFYSKEEIGKSEIEKSVMVETEFLNYIAKCIRHHQAMLQYVDEFNASFGTMFFFILLTASILICMMGFQVIVIPPKGIMFVRVVLHLTCTVFELGFFCWFGSDVMDKSASVYSAAYESEWEELSTAAKKNIGIIIMRAQRPVSIRAGLFGGLTLPTFGVMMKNAYSYLALLKQVHEGDMNQ